MRLQLAGQKEGKSQEKRQRCGEPKIRDKMAGQGDQGREESGEKRLNSTEARV